VSRKNPKDAKFCCTAIAQDKPMINDVVRQMADPIVVRGHNTKGQCDLRLLQDGKIKYNTIVPTFQIESLAIINLNSVAQRPNDVGFERIDAHGDGDEVERHGVGDDGPTVNHEPPPIHGAL
jgi:hypothetical protein